MLKWQRVMLIVLSISVALAVIVFATTPHHVGREPKLTEAAVAQRVTAPVFAQPSAPPSTSSKYVCTQSGITPGQPWKFEYSFGGTIMAPGSVELVLSSSGLATITTKRVKKLPDVKSVKLPLKAMRAFAKTLSEWPPQCMHTVLRNGYFVADLGSVSFTLTVDGATFPSRIDGCHVIRPDESFQAIIHAVKDLAPYVGESVTWSPGATTSFKSDICVQGDMPSNNSLQPTAIPLRGLSAAELRR